MSNEQIEQIDLSIEHAQLSVGNMEALQKLTKNREFKKLILEGYFEKEASRLVLLKGDPSMQEDTEQNSINKQIDAIGTVRQYFGTIMQLGRMSANAIVEHEATREEILAEDLGQE